MLAKLKSSLFSKNPQSSLTNNSQPVDIKIKIKQTTSQIVKQQKVPRIVKLIKSEPILEQVKETGYEINEIIKKKSPNSPRFIRSIKKETSLHRPKVVFKFHSPPTKIPALIHQPVQTKKQQEKPAYRREIIPPSDLVHDKMKNFDQNPEKFLLNIDQSLDKVFKKTVESIIRTAKVIPVKDEEIRDSTDLLRDYKSK